MQDDAYIIAEEGWHAEAYRVIETKKGKDGKPGNRHLAKMGFDA